MKHYTELVPFEVALLAKQNGYYKDRGYQYAIDGKICDPAAPCGYEGVCEAPTYAEVLDWFAEKEIYIQINAFPVDSARYGHRTEYEARVVDARNIYADTIRHKVERYEYAPDYTDMCEAMSDAIKVAFEIL